MLALVIQELIRPSLCPQGAHNPVRGNRWTTIMLLVRATTNVLGGYKGNKVEEWEWDGMQSAKGLGESVVCMLKIG